MENIILDCVNFNNMMDWNHINWWVFPFFGFWFIGILIAFIIIVYVIINNEKLDDKEVMSDAQKTLDNRYAKGEINREEYIQAKDDLKNFNPK
jgi:putative membrane protein